MTPLKIAIFHLAFIYSGGGEKLVLQEAEGLKKRGHKVEVFATVVDRKKSFPDIIKKFKVKTFLPSFSFFKTHEAFQTVLTCVLAPLYAHKFRKFDVIFAANQPSCWIAFIINRMYGVPYVSYLAQPTRFLHPRNIDRETGLFFAKKDSESISARAMMTTFRRFSDWADKISIRSSSQILVNGNYMKRVIEKTYKLKTEVCASGVEFKKLNRVKKEKYILVTNRHFPQKKIEYALFTLQIVLQTHKHVRLLISGVETEYTSTLKKLAVELGIWDKVEFLGYCDEKKLKRLYMRAKVYLYTAPEEDFGMGIIEAMSYGTPVVAWNKGGPSKIIKPGVGGFLATPYDIVDFTRHVLELLNNNNLAKNVSRLGKQYVAEKFNIQSHMAGIERVLLNASKNN